MKSIYSFSLVLAIGCLATAVRADEGPKRGKGGDRRAEIIKRFDKDGDGKLNEQEREAARAAFQKKGRGGKGKQRPEGKGKHKGKGGKQRPGGQDGKRPSAKELMKRFDKNDDGKIVKDEAPERAWERLAAADENKDGAVTQAELEAFAGNARGKGGPGDGQRGRPNPTEILKRMDKNNDGKLTKDEVPEQLWTRISKADKDGDGVVTKAELEAAIASMQGQRPKGGRPNPTEILKRLDKNNDGKLTKDEVPEQLWTRISRADANGDGVVTKAELEKALQGKGGPRGNKGKGKGGRPRKGKGGGASGKPKQDN